MKLKFAGLAFLILILGVMWYSQSQMHSKIIVTMPGYNFYYKDITQYMNNIKDSARVDENARVVNFDATVTNGKIQELKLSVVTREEKKSSVSSYYSPYVQYTFVIKEGLDICRIYRTQLSYSYESYYDNNLTNYIKAERLFDVLESIDFDKLNLLDIPLLRIHLFGKISEISASTNYGYEVKTYLVLNRDIIEVNAYETPNEGYLIKIYSNDTITPLLYRFIIN